MRGEGIPVRILALRTIANASPALCKAYGFPDHVRSLGFISTDCDDATYIALDEATKAANVSVVYGKSLYAGASNASTALAGEVIGILGGQNPSEVESGLTAVVDSLKTLHFRKANDKGDVVYLAHSIARTGSFLSRLANLPMGQPLAYLIAPPVEATVGLDAALKASDVELKTLFAPPTETNFAGGLLTGTQSACNAACDAFARTVEEIAANPIVTGGSYGI